MSKLNSHVKEKEYSAKVVTETEVGYNGKKAVFTTEEAAQYEVFKNGSISRETISKWIRNDLAACHSFIGGCLSDESIFRALADAFYARYEKLHAKKHDEVVSAMENRGGVS